MKKILGSLLIGLSCSSGWALPLYWDPAAGGNGHYYDVVAAPNIAWADARVAALLSYHGGLQGHLVTITSADEHAFVNGIIQAARLGEIYAGGYQNPDTEADKFANWTWVNGEGTFPGVDSASPYAKWNPGEPNDYYGVRSEQYLGLNLGPGFNDEGNLALITGYVIEYDPNTITDVPIPDGGSTLALLGGAFAFVGAARRKFRR